MFRSIALSLGHNTNLDWRLMRKINAWCWIVLFPFVFFDENIDSFMHILCCLPSSSSPLIISEYITLSEYGCPRKMVPTAVKMNAIYDSRSFSPVCLSWSENLITRVYQMNHKGYFPEVWWQGTQWRVRKTSCIYPSDTGMSERQRSHLVPAWG